MRGGDMREADEHVETCAAGREGHEQGEEADTLRGEYLWRGEVLYVAGAEAAGDVRESCA